MAGAFHCASNCSLVLCASAGLAAWSDLSIFGDVAPQKIVLFIVNDDIFIRAELADTRVGVEMLPTLWLFALHWLVTHDNNSSCNLLFKTETHLPRLPQYLK